jgi:NAD(P)-dependent dehydrogenase (short-subunit alcohol dehydrogenase family)
MMVANAGIGTLCRAVEMSLVDWRRQTAVNLDGVFLSVKYAVPAMRRAGGGSIIISSSVAGLRGSQDWPAIAPQREPYACSLRRLRWSARQKPVGYGSTPSIPGSILSFIDQ